MQKAVEPLEASVHVGGHGNEQQLDVDLIEAEAAHQAAKSQVRALALGGIGGGLDFVTLLLRLRIRRDWFITPTQ